MKRRLLVAAAVVALLAQASAALADRRPPASGDPTFHVTLTAPALPLGAWTVSGAPPLAYDRKGANIVAGEPSGQLAAVSGWDPATKELDVTFFFTNIGTASATSARMVVDFMTPAWEATLDPSGLAVQDGAVGSNSNLYGEQVPIGTIRAHATAAATVAIKVGSPGAPLPPRPTVYYHVESGPAAAPERFGLPLEPALPPGAAKLLPPPAGMRYLALNTDTTTTPYDRWMNRFEAKYAFHPVAYERFGTSENLSQTSPQSYADFIAAAVARGALPGLYIGVGGTGETSSWTYQQIISGQEDTPILAVAKAIRDSGYPVLGWFAEEFTGPSGYASHSCGADGTSACSTNSSPTASDANQYGDPNYPDGPERFRDALRHVHDLFDQAGATNVTWAVEANNSHDFAPGFPAGDGSTDQPWWDQARYFDPGPDYLDTPGWDSYDNDPNPAGALYDRPTVAQQWSRHPTGYGDWLATEPNDMISMPSDVQIYGTAPGADSQDRTPLIQEWFQTMPQFPALRYYGLFENEMDGGIQPRLGGYDWTVPGINPLAGYFEYGFFNQSEIDAIRAGLDPAVWLQQPLLQPASVPAQVVDLACSNAGPGSIRLSWTAPGAAGTQGTADHYSLKARPDADLTASNWSAYESTSLPAPAPLAGGSAQSWTVGGLQAGTAYHFGLKATAVVNGMHFNSPVSNSVACTA